MPIKKAAFNAKAELPYGLQTEHIYGAMKEFTGFLRLVNTQLNQRGMQRLESMLMPANFSSIVGEFIAATIPRYCEGLAKNRYHNGHPDLVPAGIFDNDAAQHSPYGIEVKASRYLKGWQGHNPESVFLMVFVFDCNRQNDVTPKPFRFLMVAGAKLAESDWLFSGRTGKSRRTITASVTESGYQKMTSNWVYRVDSSAVKSS